MRNVALTTALLFGLAGCYDAPTSIAPEKTQTPLLPTAAANAASAVPIPNQYIVRFKDTEANVASRGQSIESFYGGKVERRYVAAIKGVLVRLPDDAAVALAADPNVLSVEQDQTLSVSTTQAGATWGLDRMDQRALPLSTTYSYSANGTGVTVYIIDTGINFTHTEYSGRASFGTDASPNGSFTSGVDCAGHGSHVSGTVGGTTYGVAKNVKLVAVRVLDCAGNGTVGSVLSGIDWVRLNRTLPAVANMSLGGGFSSSINAAVDNAINSGVVFVVAAGNSSASACNESPSSAPNALTVGATAINDVFASFSNRGSCVDLNAPGVNITSAWIGSNTALDTISGTSMATPHVAGAAALYLQLHPSATPAQVGAALTSNATSGVIGSLPSGTPNLLLYTGFITSSNQSPTALITAPANNAVFAQGASVSFTGSASDPEDGSLTGGSLVWTSSINGQIGTGTSFTKSNLSVGTHTITLTGTDSQGATGVVTRTITITPSSGNQPPTARFTYTCPTMQCSLDGSSSSDDVGVVQWAWNWGNGRSEARSSPLAKNTWAVAGIYDVTLTVTDAGGLTNSITKQVSVPNARPTASITSPANNASFAAGASVSFSGTGTDLEDGALTGASLTWSSSINGAIGTGASFSTSALSAGVHTITLTAKDALGATGTATITITINLPPPPNQSPSASITAPANGSGFNQGASVSFSGSGSDPEDGVLTGGSLIWTSSRDGQIGTGVTFSTSTLSVGSHTITLTATDSKGATGSATIFVTITSAVPQPHASFTAVCSGAGLATHQCQFDGSSSTGTGLVTFNWNWGNGRSESHSTPIGKNTFAAAGTYNVTLTVTDAIGQTSSVTQAVVVP